MLFVRKIGAAVIVGLVLTVTGCSATSEDPCAGQCRAPFELFVGFHEGVSSSRAVGMLKQCEHLPGVLRVGWDRADANGVVWTSFFGPRSPSRNSHLSACLRRLPSVSWRAWPD